MKVVITGGGTGGHLSVAKAFLEEFDKRGYECIFVGSMGGQDRVYFGDDNRFAKKYFLQTKGVVNQKILGKISSLFQHFKAFIEALKILKQERVDFVLSVGGYSAAPAAFGAVFLRLPLIIHEQNARIGRLNNLLKPYAAVFFSSYLETSPIKFYPVRKEFFEYSRVREKVDKILFIGGSQGARAINNFALSMAMDLQKRGIKIFHQCGKNDFQRVLEEYHKLPLKIKILETMEDLKDDFDVLLFDFSKNMPKIFEACDFAVSRAGASSLWELCANGIVTLFVPYPYAAGNHQYFNAKFLEDKELGFLCEEKDLYCDVLWNILELLTQRTLSKMSRELQRETHIGATGQMVDCILERIKK